jgi:hypothetical protein
MAGIGPAPKDKSERRNKSAPQRGEWVDLEPLEAPVLPELPPVEREWSDRARVMWESWRQDPVTAQWSSADRAYAYDTLVLYELDIDFKRPNEVRLRMDGLGLTPKGKRDLRLRLVDPPDAQAKRAPRAARSGGDRRARLSVVQ